MIAQRNLLYIDIFLDFTMDCDHLPCVHRILGRLFLLIFLWDLNKEIKKGEICYQIFKNLDPFKQIIVHFKLS